jgi:hypothetical protein
VAKEKLETFKAGDAQKKARTTAKRADEAKPGASAQSLGFRRIENILEQEEPGAISQSLNKIHNDLEALESTAKSNKEKAAAKKALMAVERAADLMDYLFQTKIALQTPVK